MTDFRIRERMNWEGDQAEPLEEFLADWARASAVRSYVPGSGDSSSQAAARFIAALDDLADTFDVGQAVVVAHGGVTVDALRTMMGDLRLQAANPSLIDDGIPCCAVTTLRRDDGHWSVDMLPDAEHLDNKIGHRPA